MPYTQSQAEALISSTGVNPAAVDVIEFAMGLDAEAEHTELTEYQRACIVMDHLREDRHYYTKLGNLTGKVYEKPTEDAVTPLANEAALGDSPEKVNILEKIPMSKQIYI